MKNNSGCGGCPATRHAGSKRPNGKSVKVGVIGFGTIGSGVVKALISKGADVNIKDNLGLAPLHQAAIKGSVDVVALLLAKGADLNAKDNYQQTALQWAAMKGKRSVEEVLKNAGAKNP